MMTDELRVNKKYYALYKKLGERKLLVSIVSALTVDELEECLDSVAYHNGIYFGEDYY